MKKILAIMLMAAMLLSTVPGGDPGYDALQNAIRNLENVAASSPDVNTLASAMTMLTQAMAQVQ